MIEEFKSKLSSETEKIVRTGKDVRKHIAASTTEAMARFHQTKDGLLGIVRAVKEGAIRGIEGANPELAESKLRHVIDGLADGFGTAANAINLTIQESAAAGKHFAQADLTRVRDELKQLSSSFSITVDGFGGSIKSAAKEQVAALGAHASAASRQVIPVFEDALATVAKHAGDVAVEAGRAGVGGARAGVGALFQAVGTRLTQLGDRLAPKNTD